MGNTELTTTSAKQLTQPFESPLQTLTQQLTDLQKAPLTLTTVRLCKEWDASAQDFLKELKQSALADQIGNAYKLHRFLTSAMKGFTDPIEAGRRAVAGVFGAWERKRREEEAAERRKREEEARLEQERLRLEEAAHLESLGHKEEAETLLDSPLPPVSLPEPAKPTGKVEGISVSQAWKWGGIEDGKAFYAWLSENPAFWNLMEPKDGDWKRILTSNKGTLKIPGLKVVEVAETRHRA